MNNLTTNTRNAAPDKRPALGVRLAFTAALLLSVNAGPASAESAGKYDFEFTKVVDSTQGFSAFEQFPAINNKGAVAFVAVRKNVGQGVFRLREEELTTIATPADGFVSFGNVPAINASGVVAFFGTTTAGTAGIYTGDGYSKRLIADSAANGLAKIGIGAPAINAAGTVAFQSLRVDPGFPTTIFTGNGGPLKMILTTSKTGFISFGNVAINDAEKIAFNAILANGTQGVFTGPGMPVDIVDTNSHPEFGGFEEPAINNAGTIADVAFLSSSPGVQVFTGNPKGIVPRNDPANPAFTNADHPSMNNHGAVAFYAFPASAITDPTGIFLEVSGGHTLIPVIKPGDKLFGSTVASLELGRFALNDRFELVFQYSLADGRSGIAIASFHGERDEDDDR